MSDNYKRSLAEYLPPTDCLISLLFHLQKLTRGHHYLYHVANENNSGSHRVFF